MMMKCKVNLKIADTVILMQSRFPQEQLSAEEQKLQVTERFDNFFYKGSQRPDILIHIDIVDKLPEIHNTKPVFITYHFQDKSENWRLLKKGETYIYKCPLEDKKQIMLVNKTFNRVKAYLLPKKNKGKVWNTSDIIYDFLQVLLINYFAQRNQGIFTHSVGIKDVDDRGLLFAGKSGAGKSTTARLWHKHSKAMVLNDDRIIVRKVNGKFFIYGSPWHGEFSDYLASRIESAPLKKIFFIHHSPKNIATQISPKPAFNLLYPALFPTFWDKNCLENIAAFCADLIKHVPCYSLGFVNNEKVINFTRGCKDGKKTKI
ncbi:MAG: hypothetical protein KKC39_07435 [Candidatus Omnitrophica bacterium]|nr:hypothetical protein [Candidatus Omnitrophota bacterium]MBU4468550.1 hypothetical protein [Candidatus Omnitrophota bacterium]MCG2707766.1 hypothetical protein [Candidatus Omnitrophota bacterium]